MFRISRTMGLILFCFNTSIIPEFKFYSQASVISLNLKTEEKAESLIKSRDCLLQENAGSLLYFTRIYSGNGIDHMNINLVSLSQTGLLAGDEIGVFDSKYCVGSALIEEKNLKEDNISIPASANDTIETKPNGYIPGHKITLKLYRKGMVYLLYFQPVNDSHDIFEKGASMFALVDFSRSTGQTRFEDENEIKIYPNPFDNYLNIEITLNHSQQIDVTIFDTTGKLIMNLFEGELTGQQLFTWDGKDSNGDRVSTGVYYCRINQFSVPVIHK